MKLIIMLKFWAFAFIVLSNCFEFNSNSVDSDEYNECITKYHLKPQQIHIAIGDDLSKMVMMWSTKKYTQKSVVHYGLKNSAYNYMAIGNSTILNNNGTIQYIHYVILDDLKPNTKYKYYVGSPQYWSEEYFFKTLIYDNDWSPRVAIYGDLGWMDGYSVPSLIKMANNNRFDFVIHIGDIAYQLFSDNGLVGDYFMKAIEPIAAQMPYMVVPGNHEYSCANGADFGYNYKTRFKMPENNNEFYTFKAGKALFVAFSTEYYFTEENGSNDKVLEQKRWLESVLTEANQPTNRLNNPWIIALAHRSLYCSTTDSDCIDGMTDDTGDTETRTLELEEILYRQGVDIAFWGHYHYYDRFLPVYNRTFINTTNPYVNPLSTVHILTGSAGMDGIPEEMVRPAPQWSAFRSIKFGFTIITIVNDTHIYLEQFDVKTNHIIDSIWIIQNNHSKREFGCCAAITSPV